LLFQHVYIQLCFTASGSWTINDTMVFVRMLSSEDTVFMVVFTMYKYIYVCIIYLTSKHYKV